MGQKASEITEFDKAIADSLLKLFIESGLTYNALAEKSGVPRATLNKTLRASRVATVNEIVAISQALGVKTSKVFAQAESVTS